MKPLRLTVHMFKTPESISMIFGALQRRFVLNDSNVIKFITQSGATWIKQSGLRFRRLLREFQRKILSRTSLDRLLSKIDNSCTVVKDG